MKTPMKSLSQVALALALTCGFSQATMVLTPISLSGAVASTSSDPYGFSPNRAIDGITTGVNPDFSHTNNGANEYWRLVLPANVPVDIVRIYNRTDCCGGRLNGAVVNAFSDAGLATNVYSSAPIAGASSRIDFPLTGTPSVRALQVDQHNEFLSLAEVQLFTLSNVTLPLGTNLSLANISTMSLSQSSEYNGGQFPAGYAMDGSASNFSHTDGGAVGNAWWKANIGETMRLQSVNIQNRGDGCCPERLRDIQVEVLDGSGTPVWTSITLNPGNSSGSPSAIFLDLQALNGGVPVFGNQIRITRITDGTGGLGPDDSRVLAMGEVTFIGGSVPEASSVGCLSLALGLLLARRKRD
jgi:hypothetical protein